MLLLASLCVALTTSLAPEQLMDAGTQALLLRAQGGPALEITYTASWAPGKHRVFWSPPLRQLAADQAVLRLDPTTARVIETSFSSGRMAWTIEVPDKVDQKLIVTVPINNIDWQLQGSCRTAKAGLLLQPYLSIANNGADPIHPASIAVLSPQGDTVVSRKVSTRLTPGYRLRLPSGPPITLPGKDVTRYYADRNECHDLFVTKDAASIDRMIRLNLKSLTYLADGALPATASISITPDQGLQIDLGLDRKVFVRRVMMDDRRENPDLDNYGRVQGFDTIEEYHLEATSPVAVDLEIVEPMTASWDIKAPVKADTSQANQATLPLHLEALKTASLDYSIIKHSGTRASK